MLTYGYFYQLLIVAVFAVIIIRMITLKKDKMKIFAACIFMVYVVEAVGIFYFPVFYDSRLRNFGSPDINLIPFHSIMECVQHCSAGTIVEEVLGNVAAFLPLGLLLPILFEKLRSWKNILLCSLFLSVGIELIQLAESLITRIPGHTTDIDDVILNFIGGALGYLLFLALQAVWKSRFKARVPGGEKQSMK